MGGRGGAGLPLLTQNMSCTALVNSKTKLCEISVLPSPLSPVVEYKDIAHWGPTQGPNNCSKKEPLTYSVLKHLWTSHL